MSHWNHHTSEQKSIRVYAILGPWSCPAFGFSTYLKFMMYYWLPRRVEQLLNVDIRWRKSKSKNSLPGSKEVIVVPRFALARLWAKWMIETTKCRSFITLTIFVSSSVIIIHFNFTNKYIFRYFTQLPVKKICYHVSTNARLLTKWQPQYLRFLQAISTVVTEKFLWLMSKQLHLERQHHTA